MSQHPTPSVDHARLDTHRRTVSALVIGASGAVGRAITEELTRTGHRFTAASRRADDPAARIDLGATHGLTALSTAARQHDVVINASGIERAEIAGVLATAGTPLVDISATGAYLHELATASRAGARTAAPSTAAPEPEPGPTVVLGAGIAPGLSTALVADLLEKHDVSRATAPTTGAPEIDVAVTLGAGEVHGPAALAWTAGLAGRAVYGAPEPHAVQNFIERRTLPTAIGPRRFLRADFPDHVLLATPPRPGATPAIRSYLSTGSRLATAALGLVGRVPALRSLAARAPHIGDERWEIRAIDRATGAHRIATGSGQSRATGIIAAHAAIAAADQPRLGAVPMSAVLRTEQLAQLPGVTVG
ncbi:NAD-dependent epimerase/dehydratase family protein [Leucobacter musarum]|uniref:NAD-dependent epimerase/dehydratase family protein n=1 Tax=Leucobacter musarum TaxID=1930747 RepID=UPI0006A7E648|nr:NAD-dependent epimerase/dehydratase family protein [Leucobacter musarum]